MKYLRWLIPACLSSLMIDGWISYTNRAAQGLDFNPVRLCALFLLFAVSFFFHSRSTVREFRPRRKSFDHLRVLAAVLVICVHTFDMGLSLAVPGSQGFNLLFCGSVLALVCNPIYIMLSGALLLGKKTDRLFSFYWKRFIATAVPLFAYYLIYKAVHGGIQNLYPQNLPALFLQVIQGPFDGAPHFWLIYTILSLYLAAPFLSYMLLHLTPALKKGLFLLILLSQAAGAVLTALDLSSQLTFLFSGWAGVFLMGHLITEPDFKAWRKPLIIGGLLSALITITAAIVQKNSTGLVNTVPTMTLMAAAIFMIFFQAEEKLKSPGRLFSLISRHSYSVILIHWYVLYYLVGERFFLLCTNLISGNLFSGNPGISAIPLVLGSVITIPAVFAVSLLLAVCYDYVVVFLFQSVLSYSMRLAKGLK